MIFVLKFLVPKGFTGITIFPFVFLKSKILKDNRVTVNHEKIHLRQQIEMLILPFYIWYVVEYFVRLIQYGNKTEAYKNISFEREAYAKQKDLNYLQSRPYGKFAHYL